MKKIIKPVLAILLSAAMIFAVACGDTATNDPTTNNPIDTNGESTDLGGNEWDANQEILAVTREPGSGTRTAFVEMVEVEDADGEDAMYDNADIQQSAGEIVTRVEGSAVAIGYVSLGSLTSTNVRVLSIDGIEGTVANILSGDYAIARPFNVAHNGELSDAAQDFWNFIFSAEGQEVVADRGYIPYQGDTPAFETNGASGNVVVGGSTSVEPLMQRLLEAYNNFAGTNATVAVQAGGSGMGESNAADGTFDIGMISRDIGVDGLTYAAVATDGIVVIVNPANPLTDISMDDLRDIFLGNLKFWNEIG